MKRLPLARWWIVMGLTLAARGAVLAINVDMHAIKTGYALRCESSGPGTPRRTPPSYLVSDSGKHGVPSLTAKERATLAQIRRYVHSQTLRFAYLRREFIVYDAVDGPCIDSAPGYFVLNGKCNEYFMPSWDDPTTTIATPDCLEPPRPWIPGDHGQGRNTSPNRS